MEGRTIESIWDGFLIDMKKAPPLWGTPEFKQSKT